MTKEVECLQFDCLHWHNSKCRLSYIKINVDGECASYENKEG